ncbi:MAG: hypothetical protein WC455_10285 [Dehalococcoidia bacterium]|jgi:hypothetical protein
MRLSDTGSRGKCDFCGTFGHKVSLVASDIMMPVSTGETAAVICGRCAKRALEIVGEEGKNIDKDANPINKTIMSIRKTFKQLLAKEPYKTFRKLDIIDGEELLTDEGRDTFIDWLFSNKETAEKFYQEVAKPLMDEEERKKK